MAREPSDESGVLSEIVLVKFRRGLKSDLPSTIDNGTIYFTTDTGEMIVDVDTNRRVNILQTVISDTKIDEICS